MAWLIAPDAQGNGYATEAAAAVLHHLIDSGDVDVIHANIADANVTSAAVARRIGLAATSKIVDGERVWSSASREGTQP